MTGTLSHRGPDDSGIFHGPRVQLGHTRLAILDPSDAGHQPMTLGPLTITYNGEIYNFRELRRQLPDRFRSNCDTEVLLHLFRRDGRRCVDALRGMFAFAVWDAERGRLFAARDRLGIKPLYYRELPGGLAFASEMKALLELGRPEMDRTTLRDYFTYGYAPSPKTIWAGIRQLPAGHTLTWDDGNTTVSRYWTPSAEVRITDREQAVRRLGDLLSEIVPEHTLSDVPVGVLLSGGIDSTTVTAHLERPRTFTIGSDIRRRDESPKARAVARHFDTEHHEETARAIDLAEAVQTVPRVYDEPFGDSAAWATYLLAKLTRRHVTVALSGEGGDELFCGYPWYTKYFIPPSTWYRRAVAALLPPFSRLGGRSVQRRSSTGLERYAAYLSVFTLRQKRALLSADLLAVEHDDLWHFRRYWREDLDPLKRLQWADLHTYLPDDLLVKVDRASMAHSLEVRPPLLDHRLVEFALSIDTRLLRDVRGDRGKLVVRDLMNGRVPPGLFDQPKRGFNLPIRTWVRRDPALLRDAMERLARAEIIRRLRAPRLSHEQIWSLLVLDSWLRLQELY